MNYKSTVSQLQVHPPGWSACFATVPCGHQAFPGLGFRNAARQFGTAGQPFTGCACLSQADGMLGKGAVLSGPPSTTPSSLPSQIPRQASLLPPLPLPPRPPSVLSRLPRRQSVHVVMTSHPGRCCLSQAASWLFQLYFLSDHARVFELASFSRSCYRSAFIRLGVLWADRTFASDGCSQPALVSSPLLQWVYLPPMAHMQSCCAPCSYAAMLARNQWVWCCG